MAESNDNQRWLAYELHDRLMPWIHGARMLLTQLKVAAESAENLAIATQCLKIAAEEGRSLIGFLESCDEDQPFSLATAIEEFVEATRPLAAASQQEIELSSSLVLPTWLSPPQSWSVLRVLQQAVQNSVQHAGPCQIMIGSQLAEDRWILTVADSGIGFDPNDASQPNHFGLSSMQQRADALGGQLQINSKPGQGTTITLQLPKEKVDPSGEVR
jgi:signal transduction histidine kinase